jgi:aspartate dehydrogenase
MWVRSRARNSSGSRAAVPAVGPSVFCIELPRDVNVHAAFALMGVGFDRQRSIVVADPGSREMRHEIAVTGGGIEWRCSIASMPSGEATGSYTPESAPSTMARVPGGTYDIVLA